MVNIITNCFSLLVRLKQFKSFFFIFKLTIFLLSRLKTNRKLIILFYLCAFQNYAFALLIKYVTSILLIKL